jgi:TolB-like protein/class 3 adenylate cyclase/Tfp pilus assembly protein PilF
MASTAPTSSETSTRRHVEIAHVLFIDVVGYSKLLIDEQQQIQEQLNHVVRSTEQFRSAEAKGKLTRLPTGDGMALVFFTTPEAPVQCALEISEALLSYPRLKLRMGVHSGPVSSTTDVNDRSNIAGAAINIAERIMSCGDAGHILISKRLADDLGQYAEWQPCLHDLGEIQVKHGVTLAIVNVYTDKLGNPEVPEKIREARLENASASEKAVGQDPGSSRTSGFFEEVKRRKVYRVAVAYIIAAGGIIQIASAVFPAWELPNWSQRLLIVLLLSGFPIALILAWAFDVTPEGVRVTAPPPSLPAHHRGRRNLFILLAIGVLVSAVTGFFVLPRASARKLDKSIAVLPFQNLSDDQGNAYFADGIQDDILTNLSKIGELKVISRTSVMSYRGKTANVREIGKQLGVSNILEGSVRRSGNKVRVNVQLIDANSDEHIWASDYDRDVTDVFAIQTDLAQKITDALQAKLSPAEKSRIERKPTENGEAYLAFVQAHNLQNAMEEIGKLKQSEQLYARAIQLDPTFALAMARYSQLESWIVHIFERTPERREKARSLAQQALQLQPDLPEAHLAMGFSLYYGDNEFEAALKEFEIAQRGLPNEAEIYLALGAIQRRLGKWSESTASLEKAASLNPKDGWVFQQLALNYQMLRDFDSANKTIDRGLKVNPDGLGLWEVKSKLAIAEKGDLSVSEQAFQAVKSIPMNDDAKLKITGARADVFLLERKYAEGLREAESLSDDLLAPIPAALCGKYYLIGFARKALHDEAGARTAFLQAKELLEAPLKKSPDSPDLRIQLAKILAYLGEKDAALSEARRAAEILPESKDAFGGPEITGGVAEVYGILGENGRAIELLDGLLGRPSHLTVSILKLSPVWDPLRSDPRFQALIDKYSAKT